MITFLFRDKYFLGRVNYFMMSLSSFKVLQARQITYEIICFS
ncbi:hypothetical protein HBA_0850 [Sodalis endosymbiont of Henestaris halophilus]|nr:hypothetical protein HBA_0850 [Sodalis endosymbiont of Henestaris halophilus]